MRFGFRLSYVKIIILRSYTCNVYCAVFHSKDVLQRCWITCCFFSFPFWYTNLVFSGHTLSQGIQTNVRNCDVKFRFKQDTFIRKIMLIIRRNTLSAGLQHLNWKFNVFVHREPTFTLLLLWRVIWAARYFWWPMLIGPIKNWDPLPIPFHSVPIISGPTFNDIWTRSLRASQDFRTSEKWYNCPFLTDFFPRKVT